MSSSRKDSYAHRSELPWLIAGHDFGPTHLPAAELAAWAFELLAEVVEEWPEAAQRVERARSGRASAEDLDFTAELLARTLEADVELPMTDVVSILDHIGLPTDAVALAPRRRSVAVETPVRYRNAA